MSKPAVTVILCAHDPAAAPLRRVLAALERQTLPLARWELVVVDNACHPPLAERDVPLPANARVVVEAELGLTPARLAGFAAANAPVLVLVDDDTVLEDGYLEAATTLMAEHPEVGAAGGRIRGEFATSPKPWTRGYLDLLALRDFGDRPIRALVYNQVGPWEPCGAGMVIRREVARQYAARTANTARRRLDRVGASLSSCGDTDLARTAADMGLYLAYEPTLALTHLIPASRLRLPYLARLAYSVQRDGWLLSRLRGKECTVAGWRLWAHRAAALVRTFSPDPRRWLLRAASAYGQLKGRSVELLSSR